MNEMPLVECRFCGARTADLATHYGRECREVLDAFGPADPDRAYRTGGKLKRLLRDELGRQICRCGQAPVAYRGRCKECSAVDVRNRRARHRLIMETV